MIELRYTNRLRGRERVGIDFPVRVRIVSRTSKAVLVVPLRKRRHGCYVPRLWIPLASIHEPIHVDVDLVTLTIPMWIWERNSRPEPESQG